MHHRMFRFPLPNRKKKKQEMPSSTLTLAMVFHLTKSTGAGISFKKKNSQFTGMCMVPLHVRKKTIVIQKKDPLSLNSYFRLMSHFCNFMPVMHSSQGLEGYSRDPGFDQNTVRDSGKRKTS